MRRKTATLRTVFVVALTAALAGACWAGSARHAAAFFRMGGGHFGGARISGHSSGGRYGVRMHGGDRISHGRHRAELPSRGSEGRGGRGPRYFPHRWALGHGNGNGNGGRLGLRASGGSGGGLSGGGRIGGVPPAGERRFVPDEVVVEFHPRVSPQTIARFARIFNLTQLKSHSFALLGGATFIAGASPPAVRCPAWWQDCKIRSSSPTRSPITSTQCRTMPAKLALPPQATKRNTRCALSRSNKRSRSQRART